jgi:ABC-2 type transport system permease protein
VDLAYRANFTIKFLHSLLNLVTGVLGVAILFQRNENIQGWDYRSTLALLGVYLTVSALRDLFIAPSLEALAGIGQEVWNGNFDFTLLRPLDTQFYISFRRWNLLALIDLFFGLTVVVVACMLPGYTFSINHVLIFSLALLAGLIVLYGIMLAFTALVFWSPGFLFAWVFDGLFQLARYPIGLYPGWLKFILTWIVPIGVITTVPAQALMGKTSLMTLTGSIVLAAIFAVGSSLLFRFGARRYASASS